MTSNPKNTFTFVSLVILSLAVFVAFQNCAQDSSSGRSSSIARHYYFVEVGFQCVNMAGETITTHKGHIALNANDFYDYGSGCNDAIQVTPRGTQTFELSEDETQLNYGGIIYEYMSVPPTF